MVGRPDHPARQVLSASSLIAGKPQPGFRSEGRGHSFCDAGVSGAVVAAQSAMSTRRPSHMESSSLHLAASQDSPSTTAAKPATSASRARRNFSPRRKTILESIRRRLIAVLPWRICRTNSAGVSAGSSTRPRQRWPTSEKHWSTHAAPPRDSSGEDLIRSRREAMMAIRGLL